MKPVIKLSLGIATEALAKVRSELCADIGQGRKVFAPQKESDIFKNSLETVININTGNSQYKYREALKKQYPSAVIPDNASQYVMFRAITEFCDVVELVKILDDNNIKYSKSFEIVTLNTEDMLIIPANVHKRKFIGLMENTLIGGSLSVAGINIPLIQLSSSLLTVSTSAIMTKLKQDIKKCKEIKHLSGEYTSIFNEVRKEVEAALPQLINK